MIKIEFPKQQIKIEQRKGINEIFDIIRKKWIILSPEEWVRQNILDYLLISKNYPASLIAVEKEINLGELKKRCDIVVYNRETKPWMIIECKEMNVTVDESVVQQLLRYQTVIQAPYLIITNGNDTKGIAIKDQELIPLKDIPAFLNG